MSQKTYSQLLAFVQDKLDLRDEDFITSAEILSYTEEALQSCEAIVHNLNIEDQYFVAHAPLTLVNGKSDYNLPSNIYANKILRVVYSNGSVTTPIKRITNQGRFENADYVKKYGISVQGEYGYMLVNNDVRSGTKLRMYPTPTESSSTLVTTGTVAVSAVVTALASTSGVAPGWFVSGTGIADGTTVQSIDSATQVTLSTPALVAGSGVTITFAEPRVQIWYIRNVAIPTTGTDYIDFPEFWYFVAQHVIVNCLNKEIGNPRINAEMAKLDGYRGQLVETLANMVPDQEDLIEQDLSFADWSMV